MFSFFSFLSSSKSLYRSTVLPVCGKYALTHMEFDVIMFLFNNPSFDTAKDIVEVRRISKSHASLAVTSLEAKGLLSKEYHDGNRRTEHLVLSEKALAIGSDGRKAQIVFEGILMKGLTEEEKMCMERVLLKMNENIRSSAGE